MKTVIENQVKEAQKVAQESEKMKHDANHEAQEKLGMKIQIRKFKRFKTKQLKKIEQLF